MITSISKLGMVRMESQIKKSFMLIYVQFKLTSQIIKKSEGVDLSQFEAMKNKLAAEYAALDDQSIDELGTECFS